MLRRVLAKAPPSKSWLIGFRLSDEVVIKHQIEQFKSNIVSSLLNYKFLRRKFIFHYYDIHTVKDAPFPQLLP